MEIREAAETAKVWDAMGLHVIPNDDLAECFKRALERVEDSNFGALHVRDAWNVMQKERAEQRASERQAQGMRYHEHGVTFAQWFESDRDWSQKNLTADAQAMMKELFDKRTQSGEVDQSIPPTKDVFVHVPVTHTKTGTSYCQKCIEMSGLYWDDLQGKYRCCACDGGREKARVLWAK